MSRDRIYRIIDEIIERERGYVDHPADKGGPTNYGITQATLADWRGHPVTPDDVRRMDRKEAVKIYWRRYVRDPGFFHIANDRLAEHVVDCGVLHGPQRAVRWLQGIVGEVEDGIFGPRSQAAVSDGTLLPEEISKELVKKRVLFMANIVVKDHSQIVFLRGWIKRALSFL